MAGHAYVKGLLNDQALDTAAGPTFDHVHLTVSQGASGLATTDGPTFDHVHLASADIKAGVAAGLNECLRVRGGSTASGAGPSIVFTPRYGGDTYPTWEGAEIGGVYNGGAGYDADFVILTNTGANLTTTTEKLRITSAGKVGINDPAPAEALDVNGNINTTGVIKVADVQVLGARVVNAAVDDAINAAAWDATTAGVLTAIRDALVAHGIVTAA